MTSTGRLLILAALIVLPPLQAKSGPPMNTLEEDVTAQNGDSDGLSPQNPDPDITIYYGLNDSHSRDWVRITEDGRIGIVYFQRFDGSANEGTLHYDVIHPDGSENLESITTGTRLEKSVLLYDASGNPHVFVAASNAVDQIIDHYTKDDQNRWQRETVIHFNNEGGKFIYELSADTGPSHEFHLLILKLPVDVDSDGFMDAWIDAHLYHMTNVSGQWEKERILNYNTAYTYDMYIKSSIRQDMEIDTDGHVHVVYSEQVHPPDSDYDPSRLWYAHNKYGAWHKEIAYNYDYGPGDEAGWYPSLCLDNQDIPHISCMYVNRVRTGSAVYCKLFLLKRSGDGQWQQEIIADRDDGYYGGDGRSYTGGLSHLRFDKNNTPYIIFSDIASTHWPGTQRLNVGNIRYAVFENDRWKCTTLYRQPLPEDYFTAVEMHGMTLLLSEANDTFHIIGQELITESEREYTSKLLHFAGSKDSVVNPGARSGFSLQQNYPNPFNSTTSISYSIRVPDQVTLKIYDGLGAEIRTLCNAYQRADTYAFAFDAHGLQSGVYYYQLTTGNGLKATEKMIVLK